MLHHDNNFPLFSQHAVCLQTASFPHCNICLHIAWFVFKTHCPHPLFRSPSYLLVIICLHFEWFTSRMLHLHIVCLHITLFVLTPSLSDHTVHAPHSRTRRGTNSSEQDASHPFPGVVLVLGVTVRAADVGRGGGAGGGTQVLQQW